MTAPRIVLVHGVATTPAIFSRLAPLLKGKEVIAVARPCSGDLDQELAAIEPYARNSFVVGVSGGATLGLALASRIPLAGAVLHEPAVGSLSPGLLAPMAAAYASGGVNAFARLLYGWSWNEQMLGPDVEAAGRELPMFRSFEPQSPLTRQGPVLVTVGGESSPARHEAVATLHDKLGYEWQSIEGCSHFVQWDAPRQFAAVVLEHYSQL